MKRKLIKYIDNKYFSYGDTIICIDEITDFFIEKNNLATDVVKHFGLGSVSGLYQILKYYGIKKPGDKRGELSVKGCLNKYGVRRANQLLEYKEKIKNTNIKNWGIDYPLKLEKIKNKSKLTCLEKYGVEIASQSKEIYEKIRKTNLERYGVEIASQNEKIKDKVDKFYWNKYGISHYNYIYNKMKENNSFKYSKYEENFYAELLKIFNEKDIEREFMSEKYPFKCDFYIKPLDYYIELNFHFSHGEHPFNNKNINDLNILKEWEFKSLSSSFYKKCIDVWTKRDPLKLKTAKENKLNYFTCYTKQDIKQIIDKIIKFKSNRSLK